MKKIFTLLVLFVVSLYSMVQAQTFYEWKNDIFTKRDMSELDSITFDVSPYDRLTGSWKMEVISDYDGTLTFDVNVYTNEASGTAYGKYYIVTGLSGYDFMTARLDYSYDESTNEGYVSFKMPVLSVKNVNFGSFIGDIYLYGVSETNQLFSSAEIKGVWNDDMSEITFEATPKMGMIIFVNGSAYSWWDRFVVAKMVRTNTKYNSSSRTNVSSQYFYEWKNGACIQRYVSEVDSISFSTPVATKATCKEVCEAPDGKNFLVTGTVTRVLNTTYGNWYMTDGTAELYIYGTLDAEGNTKNFASLGIEVGDKVTIEGIKSSYNGSPEMVDVTVRSIEKALLKILSESTEVGEDGGKLKVKLSSKGKGVYFSISEECQEWISYESVDYKEGISSELDPNPADTVVYTFDILPNDAVTRTGTISFFTNEGEPISFSFTQAGGIANVTVAEFLAAEVNDYAKYRIVGHVTGFNKYNNNFYIKDWSGEVYAYYVDTQGYTLAIGDFVTLVGKRAEYNGTPQMPKGTLLEKYTASPEVSVAEFLTKEDSKEIYYKLTGTITSIANPTYGNIYITDANGDEVYVYGLLPGYGATGDAKKGLVEAKGLKLGDTITIVGNKASNNGSSQVGNAVYLSH
ncbi:MAG: hypothetical protein IKT87_06705 [Bacteroidaceae bacterium]|nr:hypothetical protein [Bacteroidaceae bacterium]